MKDYRFLQDADEEMNEQARFYEGRSEGLGLDFLDEVEHTVESILAFPKGGRVVSKNLRRRIMRRFPPASYTPSKPSKSSSLPSLI